MPIYTKGALYAALVALDYTERHEASLKSSIKFNEIQDEIPVLLEVVELPLMHSELYEDRDVKACNVEQWFHSVLKRDIFHLTDSLWTDIGSTTNLSSPVDTKLRFYVVMFSSNQIFDPGINLSVLKLLVDLGSRQMDYYWSGFNVTSGDIADFYSRKAFRLILKDSSTLALDVIEKLSLAYLVESLLNSFKSINIGIYGNFQNLILLAKLLHYHFTKRGDVGSKMKDGRNVLSRQHPWDPGIANMFLEGLYFKGIMNIFFEKLSECFHGHVMSRDKLITPILVTNDIGVPTRSLTMPHILSHFGQQTLMITNTLITKLLPIHGLLFGFKSEVGNVVMDRDAYCHPWGTPVLVIEGRSSEQYCATFSTIIMGASFWTLYILGDKYARRVWECHDP